jgi:hypothetical protein
MILVEMMCHHCVLNDGMNLSIPSSHSQLLKKGWRKEGNSRSQLLKKVERGGGRLGGVGRRRKEVKGRGLRVVWWKKCQ